MSRSVLAEKRITIADIRQSYLHYGNSHDVAEEFGICDRTVRKYVKKAGIVLRRGRRQGESPGKTFHTSCLAVWLRTHPDQLLPPSVKDIAEMTDCTTDEVKTYLYRRRTALKRRVQRINYNQSVKKLYDVKGVPIAFALWDEILDIKVETYTFALNLTVKLRSGHVRQFHLPRLADLLKAL